MKHKEAIEDNIKQVEEVILLVGCNDVQTGGSKQITSNIDDAVQQLKELNSKVRISISSIFLGGDKTYLNQKIVETNDAIKTYCGCHGMDFIHHGNIAFKHLDSDKLHLNSNGSKFFLRI